MTVVETPHELLNYIIVTFMTTKDILKNAVFWDVALCRYFVNRRLGGTSRLHLQGRKIRERGTSVIRSIYKRSTKHHIPEDGILHSHRCENLKSYKRYSHFLAFM
jgi:hypothetical protein